ncbi:hypothetical protein Tco_0665804 [Tanacetum coccineum]
MASDDTDQDARYAVSKLLQRGTMAVYESEFLMLIKRVKGISESLLKSFYISGLKPAPQCALLMSNPTTLSKAFSLACATEARFAEDALSKLLQMELPVQDLKATIRYKPNKVEAVKTSMVATSEELEQQEYQDDLTEIYEEKDNAKPPIFADTFGNNGGNDSKTTGPEAPVKEVVDSGIESEVVVGLPGKFQEGDMVDVLLRVM